MYRQPNLFATSCICAGPSECLKSLSSLMKHSSSLEIDNTQSFLGKNEELISKTSKRALKNIFIKEHIKNTLYTLAAYTNLTHFKN